MRIAIVGSGYVGLVSGVCLAEFGHDVVCVDKDQAKIESLKKGMMPIYEPGLDELVLRNTKRGNLLFTTDLHNAVSNAEVVFIAVGTPPSTKGDGYADLQYVFAAAGEIAACLGPHHTVIVTKSTVPVGTGRRIAEIFKEKNPDAQFDIASNPEFLREGAAIGDFMRPDRVVIGVESEKARAVMQALYRPLFLIETPIVVTDLETAELIKYAANAFLATKITFINQIADLCEKVGADVHQVAKGIGLDGRIGKKFLHPGPGYGGSCFPKDTRALVTTARDHDVSFSIIEAVVTANENRKQSMAGRIAKVMGGDIQGKTIAILGLTFKLNTDDMRESVSLDVVPALQKAGAKIQAFDPAGMEQAARFMKNVTFAKDAYQAIEGADALVILTEWHEFRALDLARVKKLLKQPVFIDLRNIYRPTEMRELGFTYHSVGRR